MLTPNEEENVETGGNIIYRRHYVHWEKGDRPSKSKRLRVNKPTIVEKQEKTTKVVSGRDASPTLKYVNNFVFWLEKTKKFTLNNYFLSRFYTIFWNF